ncbi:protein kinase [Candidatus Obscuribacterales bacterium]|nr:protein kinase [Candidatus Obscuribacterales bacterium]
MGNGSLTQWIVACQCLENSVSTPAIGTVTKLCSTCGKAVSEGRQGSMTQWIFRIDTCKCANPTVIFGKASGVPAVSAFDLPDVTSTARYGELSSAITGGVVLNDEPGLEVDPDKFPSDRYKAVELLGQGMNGIVFRAHDTLLARTVAIKSVRVSTKLTAEQVLQFQREAKATSQLEHRNLIQLFDFGITTGGVPFLVMEFFRGYTLTSLIEREKCLPVILSVQLLIEICRGVEHAHQRGVMHRDLKSNNILLLPPDRDEYWSCKIIDFGLAALPATSLGAADKRESAMIGSPAYMSPEQVRGYSIDYRSDIYALGCIFFEMLTGEVPFVGDSALATMMMHIDQVPPLVSDRKAGLLCGDTIDAIVSKTLQKNAEDRFESVTELKEELKNLLVQVESEERSKLGACESEPITAGFRKNERRKPKVVYSLLFGCVSIVLLAVLGLNAIRLRPAPKPEPNMTATMHSDKDFFGLPPVPEDELKAHSYPMTPRERHQAGLIEQDNLYLSKNRNLYIKGHTLRGGADADDDSLKVLEDPGKFPQVEELAMRGTSFHGPGLRFLSNRPIKYVDLSENQLSLSAIPLLAKFSELTRASLNHCVIADGSDFTPLGGCKKLQELSVSDSKLSDGMVKQLCKTKSLLSLNLAENPGVSDSVVADLCSLPSLGSLDIGDTSISSRGFLQLIQKRSLLMLNGNTIPLSDGELLQLIDIMHAKNMQSLSINCNLISDEAALKLLSLRSSCAALALRGGRNFKGGTRAKLKSVWPSCFDFDDTRSPRAGRD